MGTAVPHVLIADDDFDIRTLVEIQIEMMGFTSDSVADGRAALDALTTKAYDLAILDQQMPEATGIEVTKRIRAADHDLPIIMMSAFSTDQDIRRGLDAGADRYLTKPVSLRVFREVVEDLLRDRLARSP
jgi:DNA-binding response OmpR family regulator